MAFKYGTLEARLKVPNLQDGTFLDGVQIRAIDNTAIEAGSLEEFHRPYLVIANLPVGVVDLNDYSVLAELIDQLRNHHSSLREPQKVHADPVDINRVGVYAFGRNFAEPEEP